jgi:hypothetical protein
MSKINDGVFDRFTTLRLFLPPQNIIPTKPFQNSNSHIFTDLDSTK